MENSKAKQARLQNFAGIQLSENAYNGVIGLTLLWGIIVNVLMATVFAPAILKIDFRLAIVLYLVLSFGCMFLIYRSNNPAVSFLGFTGLAIGMGLLLTSFVQYFSGHTIYTAFLATGIVVVVMMLVSLFYPAFFLSMGRVLGLALLGSLIIELIGGLIFKMPMDFMDYVVVVIFAGYIGFDWAKAQLYPKTVDNAIDSAADIYVDIVNIFIRILSIIGKNDSN